MYVCIYSTLYLIILKFDIDIKIMYDKPIINYEINVYAIIFLLHILFICLYIFR